MAPTVVLLHGFTHTGRSWDPVVAALGERYTAIAPDIRGHGDASGAEPVTLEAVIGDIDELAPERFTLVGYSMGGRIALHAALGLGERVRNLVLIGASPGLADPAERARRRADDDALADEMRALDDRGVRAAVGADAGAGRACARGRGRHARRPPAQHPGRAGPRAARARHRRAAAVVGSPGRADDAGER